MDAQDKMAVRLRPVERRDAAAMIRANIDSRALHTPWVEPFVTQDGFDSWFEQSQGLNARKVVLLAEAGGAMIGVVNLNEIVRGAFLSAYLGYFAFAGPDGRSRAGGGRMTEAVRQAVAYAFGPVGLHRVEANIQPDNAPSLALVRRLGFRLEGFSPRYLRIAGAWRDHERWTLLAEDAGMDAPGQR